MELPPNLSGLTPGERLLLKQKTPTPTCGHSPDRAQAPAGPPLLQPNRIPHRRAGSEQEAVALWSKSESLLLSGTTRVHLHFQPRLRLAPRDKTIHLNAISDKHRGDTRFTQHPPQGRRVRPWGRSARSGLGLRGLCSSGTCPQFVTSSTPEPTRVPPPARRSLRTPGEAPTGAPLPRYCPRAPLRSPRSRTVSYHI